MTRTGCSCWYGNTVRSWSAGRLSFPEACEIPARLAAITAARELKEETGYEASELVALIECDADVGRLCNKFFGFFALAEQVADAEPGIELLSVNGEELKAHAVTGRIACASQIGLLYLGRRPSPRAGTLSPLRLPDGAVAGVMQGTTVAEG